MTAFLLTSAVVARLAQSFSSDWSSEFTYNAYLNEAETFRLYWTDLENDEMMEFGMEAQATGWIAIGVSSNGQMPNSDIAIGWVDDEGQVYLQDRYTTARSVPLFDAHQNLTLISGEESDGWTRIRFTRPKFPCNDEDKALSQGTTRMIWAYNEDTDPEEECFDGTSIEAHTNQGAQSLNLQAGSAPVVALEDDVQTVDIIMTNFSVPAVDTTYHCKVLKLPISSLHHAVKFEMVIDDSNEYLVHHSRLQTCVASAISDDSALPKEGLCYSDEMAFCRFGTSMYGWAVGGEPVYLPANAGIPIGEGTSFLYVKLEVHYDNPTLRSDMVDSSGVRISYTSQLRDYDAGVFMTGIVHVTPERAIYLPPGLDTLRTAGYLSAECTDVGIPDQGIHVVSSYMHAHKAASALNLRHIREAEELPPIDSNWAYDPDYQQTVRLHEEVLMLPGDALMLECYYNTSTRSEWTLDGFPTTDEMCIVYLTYYPAADLAFGGTLKTEDAWRNWMVDAQQAGYLSGTADDVDAVFANASLWSTFEYASDTAGAEQFYNRMFDDAQYSDYNEYNNWCSAGASTFITTNFTAPVDFEVYAVDLFECSADNKVEIETHGVCTEDDDEESAANLPPLLLSFAFLCVARYFVL